MGKLYTGTGKDTGLRASADEPASCEAEEVEDEDGDEEREGDGEDGDDAKGVGMLGTARIAGSFICSSPSEISRSLTDERCGPCGNDAGPSSWRDWRAEPSVMTATWEPPMNGGLI